MRLRAVFTLAVLIGRNWAASPSGNTARGGEASSKSAVLIRLVHDSVPKDVLAPAELPAGRILARAGIELNWSTLTSQSNLSAWPRIDIELTRSAPDDDSRNALASAAPFANEGTRIHIFMDRIERACSCELFSDMLGHVFAHEITHLLQARPRHSVAGLMKAHWAASDLDRMRHRPLALTGDDIDIIRGGLAALRRTAVSERLSAFTGW